MRFDYSIKAHPTLYENVMFRSRLEAHWACFFHRIGWYWEYEPIDLIGWTPDFRLNIPCTHSECSGGHSLLIEVKPYTDIKMFEGHPCLRYPFGCSEDGEQIQADASAAFGLNPAITYWQMAHGAGGGDEELTHWLVRNGVRDWEVIWKLAANEVQWKPL